MTDQTIEWQPHSKERQFETSDQTGLAPTLNDRPLSAASSLDDSVLETIAQRVLWLATAMIDAANRRS